MLWTVVRYLLGLCGFLLVGALSGISQDRRSVFQSWNEVQLIVPLSREAGSDGKMVNKITAIVNGIARFGRKDDLTDGRMGVELDFRVNKYLTIITSGLYRGDEVTEGVRQNEIRLDVGGTLSAVWKQVSFRDRNLYERRLRSNRSDINVYRHRLQISVPVKRNGKVIFSPFLSEEAFYDFSADRFNNNELFLGITRRLSSRTELDIAYIRNDTSPANVNGVSLNLKVTLR